MMKTVILILYVSGSVSAIDVRSEQACHELGKDFIKKQNFQPMEYLKDRGWIKRYRALEPKSSYICISEKGATQ